MDFLTIPDFKGILADTIQTDLSAGFDKAEKMAISELDPLRVKYDIDGELDKNGDNRNITLVRMVVNITAYYVYNTVVDDEIPQRIIDNWKHELATIEKIASGKMNSTLDSLTDDDGNSVTVFRWNSNPKRSHSLYPKSTTAKDTI